ncbi:hypothetical protein PRIPAC_96402, partial [Pristionchus pacificus]|uniref:Uncharacterized protein n=1 Tax=Pristionchus pacificus TaxID=54126 RepID=A0A2A6B326_PRIPA
SIRDLPFVSVETRRMKMLSNIVVKVLLLFIFMSVTGASLHDRAEEQRRKERGAETADIAIDVLYKLPPTAPGNSTFVESEFGLNKIKLYAGTCTGVALVSFGFVLGATALLAYRLAIPKKGTAISAV